METERLAQALRDNLPAIGHSLNTSNCAACDAVANLRTALAEYDALASLATAAVDGESVGDPERYFMDHGMIHDRKTGQHISKHALGSKIAPSCFGCGDELQTWDGTTRHLELMDIFLCAKCATACKSSAQVAALTAQCQVAEESLSIMHAQHKEESARIDELTAQCEGLRKELSEARGMLVACYAMAQNEVVVVTVPDDWRKANLAVSNMSIERDALRIKLAAIAASNGEGV